jgi:hypothetical protein
MPRKKVARTRYGRQDLGPVLLDAVVNLLVLLARFGREQRRGAAHEGVTLSVARRHADAHVLRVCLEETTREEVARDARVCEEAHDA